MKKKLLAILLAISCLFTFSNNANAVTASNSQSELGGGTLTGPNGFYSGYYAKATFGGVEAFCIDPGKKAVANGTDCPAEVLSGDSEFTKAAEYIFSSNKAEKYKGTAVRIVAIVTGTGSLNYGTSSANAINARCGYISAAYQAAKLAGTTVKSTGLTGYKSSNGAVCTSWAVKGDSINFAAEALKYAKSANSSTQTTGEKPTAKVTTKNGKAQIIVTANDKTGPVTVNINCDENTKGDCGEKTINSTTTFNVESKVNNTTQCGTFTATMTYDSKNVTTNGLNCTEITKFNCGVLQSYVGCSKKGGTSSNGGENPGGGSSNKTTETIKDPNNGGDIIQIVCDDKKKECPYNDEIKIIPDGTGLCDATGKEVIKVGEAALYTQDVEDCIIDNEKFLVSTSATGVCKTYCVEDYSFESDGLMLSSQDKDENGLVTITAGSYFNFENPDAKAKETGVVKCYTKLDLNTFRKNVETAAQQDCAANMKSETHSCNCTTDSETGVTSCTDNIVTTTYTAHYTNNKIEFIPKAVTTVEHPSNCDSVTNITADTNSCKSNYKSDVNRLISELESCEQKATDEKNYSEECNSKVVFDYGYNVTPITINAENKQSSDEVKYHANCNGVYEDCTSHSNTKQTASLDLGIGESVNYPTLEYVEKISTITADYPLKGVNICNDYNAGETYYYGDGITDHQITKEECTSVEGRTWVQGWPISYDTPQDGYKYEVTATDFGHIKKDDQCKTLDHYITDKVIIGCEFRVNGCTECEFTCDPDMDCDPKECDQDCIYECAGVGCIYDSGNGLALNYQPISTVNVDSAFAYLTDRYSGVRAVAAGRTSTPRVARLAVTASHRDVSSVNWGTEKGKATIDIIADQGEEIYAKEPEYKVTLNMSKINKIKKDNARETDGFLNRSLKCKVADASMEYVTCESEFLKGLKSEGILEYKDGSPKFESIKEISNYITGYNITSARKSGTGPAWK